MNATGNLRFKSYLSISKRSMAHAVSYELIKNKKTNGCLSITSMLILTSRRHNMLFSVYLSVNFMSWTNFVHSFLL